MAKDMNFVAKLTLQDKEFVNGLINSKREMIKFQDKIQKFGGIVKSSLGALGVTIAGAEIFKSLTTATQTFGDKWENTMLTAKTSFQVFENAVVSGNSNILLNFKQSIAAAREFAEAMDAFGSAQISNQYARMKYVTPFNEAMTKYRSMKAEGNATGMAFAGSEMQRWLNSYSENSSILMKTSMEAVTAKLSAYTGGYINSSNVNKYLDQLYLEIINGVIPPIVEDAKKTRQANKKTLYYVNQARKEMEEKYGPDWEREASVMQALSEINDDALKEMLEVLKTYDSVRNEINGMRRQMNKVLTGETTVTTTITGGGSYTPPTRALLDMTPTLTPISAATPDDTLQKMDALGKKLAYTYDLERMNAEMALEWQMRISELTTYADAVNSVANAFSAIGEAMGETPFGKFMSTMGTVAQQIVSLTNTYAQLLAVTAVQESMKAGLGIPFPFNIAMIGAAVTSLFSIISAAKSNFAGAFAEGGIVGGNSYTGDHLFARVNSGEMILNRAQQAALFGNSGGDVHFIIEGSQLKGVLDNYNKISAL